MASGAIFARVVMIGSLPPPTAMSRRFLRWGLGAGAAVLCAALVLGAWTYAASEVHFRSFASPPPFSHPIATDSAGVARGDHLVRTRGCRGCHGNRLQGQRMWGYAVAPNLATYARQESPATFERALRHGIARDGRAVYSMPAYNFVRLRDEDVADIYAYLRSVPIVSAPLPRAHLPWPIRWEIARGRDGAIPKFLDKVPPLRRADDPDSSIVRGEYIAMTSCNECHGFSLRADSPFGDEAAPDLAIVSGYPFEAFERLMRTGKPIGGRELPMMSDVARGRFAYFTDQEVRDVYTFLRDVGARAMKGQTDSRRTP